jgi:hypothetical protein
MAPLFTGFRFGFAGVILPDVIMDNRPISEGGGSGKVSLGPFDVSSSTNITVTGDVNVRIRVAGAAAGAANGSYVEGTVKMYKDQTYYLYKNSQYAALFYGANTIGAPTCILLGAQGGNPANAAGGPAGYPAGSSGSPRNNSGGGGGGVVSGYLSGSGGGGGGRGGDPALPANPGTPGGLFSAGSGGDGGDGNGGPGGFGYYGGGGGGGGWDYGSDYGGLFGGGGGGGASYAHGLPPSAPYPAPVNNVTSGSNNVASYMTFVSITPV